MAVALNRQQIVISSRCRGCGMAVKSSFLWSLFCSSHAKKQPCPKSASSCDECIRAGSGCAWCTSPHAILRCATPKKSQSSGCHRGQIYNPSGSIQVVKNDSGTDSADNEAVLSQPQQVSLRSRPGVSESFPLSISTPTDQPIPELIMDLSSVPAGVNVTFSSTTKGNPHLLQVSVEAAQCSSKSGTSNQNRTGPWSILITPRGFSASLKSEITMSCECNCTGNGEENSPDCNGHGTSVCGQCECYEPYYGQRCQENDDATLGQYDYLCRSGPNAPLCSGRGHCVEGFCECHQRADPQEKYSGRYCECSNFDCPYHNNRLCGGNGRCQCGKCVCRSEWIGEDCSCSMETASCMSKNQMICNGRGVCECGTCRCLPQSSGPTCEECPACVSACQEHAACAECRAFGTGANKDTCDQDCGHLPVRMVETKEELQGRLCKLRTSDDFCVFYYSSSPSSGQSTVARAKEC